MYVGYTSFKPRPNVGPTHRHRAVTFTKFGTAVRLVDVFKGQQIS